MQHAWSLICKKSVVDQETNNLSIYDVVERLSLSGEVDEQFLEKIGKKEPVHVPYAFELVSFWYKESKNKGKEEKMEMVVEFWGTEKKLSEFSQEVSMGTQTERMRTRVKIDKIPVVGSGLYVFKVKQKGKRKPYAEIPLEINLDIKRSDKGQVASE